MSGLSWTISAVLLSHIIAPCCGRVLIVVKQNAVDVQAIFTLEMFQRFYECMCSATVQKCQAVYSESSHFTVRGITRENGAQIADVKLFSCRNEGYDQLLCEKVMTPGVDICSDQLNLQYVRVKNTSLCNSSCVGLYFQVYEKGIMTEEPDVSLCSNDCSSSTSTHSTVSSSTTVQVSQSTSSKTVSANVMTSMTTFTSHTTELMTLMTNFTSHATELFTVNDSIVISETTKAMTNWTMTSDDNDDDDTGLIIGLTVGAAVLLLLLIFIVVICWRKRKRRNSRKEPEQYPRGTNGRRERSIDYSRYEDTPRVNGKTANTAVNIPGERRHDDAPALHVVNIAFLHSDGEGTPPSIHDTYAEISKSKKIQEEMTHSQPAKMETAKENSSNSVQSPEYTFIY